MIDEALVSRFASTPEAPLLAVPRAWDDPSDPCHDDVQAALDAIDASYVREVMANPHARYMIEFLTRGATQAEAARKVRVFALVDYLNHEIPRRRCQQLLAQDSLPLPAPYDHPSLEGLKVDNSYLVGIREFSIRDGVLGRAGHGFALVPPVESVNSAYWFGRVLMRPELFAHARVRLDPFIHLPLDLFPHLGYRMWVYGVPFNWDRIQKLRQDEHGRWFPDPWCDSGVSFTDYVWSPRGQELHFRCEEVPVKERLAFRGARYLHAVLDLRSATISHLDGALRLYSGHEWADRAASHVRRVGKIGKRVKLFQIDADIPRSTLEDLATTFFVWNADIGRYFGPGSAGNGA